MSGIIIYSNESYKVVGACFKVYTQLGCGFLEAVYQECLAIEFMHQKIPFIEQKEISLHYREQRLRQTYRLDFLCFDKVIVELKAISKLRDEHRAQVLNYLNVTNYKLALLVNFGHYPKLEYERIVLSKFRKSYG